MSAGHAHGGGLASVEAAAAGDSPVHRLDPRAKILGLIGLVVVSVATPVGAWAAFGAYLAALVVLTAVARLRTGFVARRMAVELPFVLAAAVLVLVRGSQEGLTLAARITTSVLAMVLLSSTTPFPQLLRGFERLRAPSLMVMIVAFMWRYLHVIGEEVRRMRVAREARGYAPRNLWQARSAIGGTIATLFIRSLERGERVYLAMLSRGYTGGIPAVVGAPLALRAADVAFLAGLTAYAAAARLLLT